MSSPILIDSNVLLDVITEDPAWLAWSSEALIREADRSRLIINPVIYGEISVGYARIEDLERALPDVLEREAIPYEAAFLAGKAFVKYRRQGGMRNSTLPDFLIGAHASVKGYTVLTRDPRRYRSYFPTLALIAPDLA